MKFLSYLKNRERLAEKIGLPEARIQVGKVQVGTKSSGKVQNKMRKREILCFNMRILICKYFHNSSAT